MDYQRIEEAVTTIINAVGEDPHREGLLNTPERVGRMYAELLEGYTIDPAALVNNALFHADYDEMIVVRDIEFASLCEHHMLPFIGHAHVAYIPKEKIIGLSKIPRIVDMFGRRLQIQERMTREIADFLTATVEPQGVGVVIEALHMCSMIRGVEKDQARMVTSAMVGVFKRDPRTRGEFMQHIYRPATKEL